MKNTLSRSSQNKGFTLIELLVVISVISFLSSVVLSSLTSARINARDAQRISDIRQIRIALELYRQTNGNYPIIGYWINSYDGTWTSLQTALAPYIKLPKDPTNSGPNPWANGIYSYAHGYDPALYPTNTTYTYDLLTQFENTNNPLRASLKGWIFRADLSRPWWPGAYSANIYTGEY